MITVERCSNLQSLTGIVIMSLLSLLMKWNEILLATILMSSQELRIPPSILPMLIFFFLPREFLEERLAREAIKG